MRTVLLSDQEYSPNQGFATESTRSRPVRRWYRFIILVLLLACVTMAIPRSRKPVLSWIGHILVVEQPRVTSADIIIVAIDADGAGTLEAADLVHRGVSNRVAVFTDPPTPVDREFLRRGLPYQDQGAIATHQLELLGVQNVVYIPRVSGSTQEGEVLPQWCDNQGYRSVVLVTSSHHSRRLSRILRRSMRGHQANVIVYNSAYSLFDPDSWWENRGSARTGIVELQKLLLDFIRHPVS